MDNITLLKEAINSQRSIEFEYIREDKTSGKRKGNPHALFVYPGKNTIEIHIFQTEGVSDSQAERPIPSWRLFIVEFMENIRILEEKFSVAEGYNPDASFYENAIAKI